MQASESRHREMNASPCRKIEKMMNKHADRKKRHIEFIEGLLTYLADGFLGCQLFVEPHGNLTQRASQKSVSCVPAFNVKKSFDFFSNDFFFDGQISENSSMGIKLIFGRYI